MLKKALKIISISAGIVSVGSAIVLGCIYLSCIVGYLKKAKQELAKIVKSNLVI